MNSLITVLRFDNEDNALIGLKIIVDLHKNYKNLLEEHVQPFLDIVREMYQNMDMAVTHAFSDDDAGKELLTKSMFSFKVLSECPVIVALLISLHRKFSQGHVPILVPLMMTAISLQPPEQRLAHERMEKEGLYFVGRAPRIKQVAMYTDLKCLQVKV
jgi:transformation/transcription domain-associated protein